MEFRIQCYGSKWVVQRRYFWFFWITEREIIDSGFYEYEAVIIFDSILEASQYIANEYIYETVRRRRHDGIGLSADSENDKDCSL